MTATVDNAVADLQRANAELQRQLDQRTPRRDEAIEQQIATAEVLLGRQLSPAISRPCSTRCSKGDAAVRGGFTAR